jgi:hypothetical protein
VTGWRSKASRWVVRRGSGVPPHCRSVVLSAVVATTELGPRVVGCGDNVRHRSFRVAGGGRGGWHHLGHRRWAVPEGRSC